MTDAKIISGQESEVLFFKALIKAKAAFKPLQKTKTNPHFKSAYAGLDDIADAVDEALAANGLNCIHQERIADSGLPYMRTVLHHVAGWNESTERPSPEFGKAQEWGSWQTYAKRYGKAGLLDLVADDDDDGNGASPAPRSAGAASGDSPRPASAGPDPGQPSAQLTKRMLGKLKDLYGDGKPWEGVKAEAIQGVFGTTNLVEIRTMPVDNFNQYVASNWDTVTDRLRAEQVAGESEVI